MRARSVLTLGLAAALALAGCTSSTSGTGSAPPSSSTPSGTGGGTPTSPSAASGASTSPSTAHSSPPPSSGTGSGPAVIHQTLTHFRIVDATFIGDQVWALGSADCLSGGGTCDAIEYSGDGGRSWRSAPAPHADIAVPERGCSGVCVAQIRFASSRIGYAFGAPDSSASAFFMTTDGGNHWQREPGQVLGLEALDGTVIRIVQHGGGCPGPCHVRAQTAAVGSTSWTTRTLPGLAADSFVGGLSFARAGGHAYLQIYQNPAGGGRTEHTTLWTSADDGTSWTNRGEPCPQAGREVDGTGLTAAPDGSATVLCRPRGINRQFTATSTNGGRTFTAGSKHALGSAVVTGFGAASAKVLLISLGDTFRSTDGGRSFTRLAANAGSSPGNPSYLGFGSTQIGHAITKNRTGLATTTDGGATWRTTMVAS